LQDPFEQVSPGRHALPQLPQLVTSVFRSLHEFVQHFRPPEHCAPEPQVQLPLVHAFDALGSQTLLQLPQFSLSDMTSVQVVPQQSWLALHELPH
jgi:hypothetical protein